MPCARNARTMRTIRFSRQQAIRIVAAFTCVYLFWGSAFVAIRYSVQTVHPAFVAGIRYLIAGLILLTFLALRGYSLRLKSADMAKVTGLGLLMFTCNTVLLSYGGKVLSAGLTALLISTIPLFITLLEAVLSGRGTATTLSWAGAVTGFLGIALLLGQGIHVGMLPQGAIVAACGLLIAAFAWALGSVLLTRMSFAAPLLVCTCWQMLIGGAVDMLIGVGVGGFRSSRWSLGTWLSLVFLAVGCTLLGYTSYSFLLRRVSITSVATYAYINPLVAILLGWLFLDEPLVASQSLGLVIVLGSVAVVVSNSAPASRVSAKGLEASRP